MTQPHPLEWTRWLAEAMAIHESARTYICDLRAPLTVSGSMLALIDACTLMALDRYCDAITEHLRGYVRESG